MINAALDNWLDNLQLGSYTLQNLAEDASIRHYFRVVSPQRTYIVMDSSADIESATRYIHCSRVLKNAGLKVPEVFHADPKRGFLLITDFGDDLYLNKLNDKTAEALYQKAFKNLCSLQTFSLNKNLPCFDEVLFRNEMELFRQWYIPYFFKKQLSGKENKIIDEAFEKLIQSALSQPKVFVHRDYHSKNLMCLPNEELGLLDFQDSLYGPITYDIVSLLKDCYIDWPRERILNWLEIFYDMLCQKERLKEISFKQFLEWFDKMGLQRHIKCLGLFVRLKERDHKSTHLQYLPRVLNYVKETASAYEELLPFYQLLKKLHTD